MIYKGKISLLGSKQIIFVDSRKKKLYLYEKKKDTWQILLKTTAYLGKNGVTKDKKEGDGKTPAGIYKLGKAFGMHKILNTNLEYIRIKNELYWVDDSNSKYYNKLVNIKEVEKDWMTSEHLIEFPKEYEYGIIIKYNTKCIKQKGSAIFLHCSTKKYTAGCIAINKEKMLELLKLLKKQTIIFIV